jgi:DNA-binding transcriptional LysR family regulator
MRITPLPPLQCLVAFEAAARHASFTRAASELHVTQGAVSKQISQLEEFLGRSLFVREYRCLRLTAAGEKYAIHIRALLAGCAGATSEVMKHQGHQKLTIACSSGVAVLWLTSRLPQFRRLYPQVKLRWIVQDALSLLSPSEFDVGIYLCGKPDAVYTARRLFDEEIIPVCAPSYLANRVLTPADLVNETLLVQEDGLSQWWSWPKWFRTNGIDMPLDADVITINHYTQLLHMAVLGQGILLGYRPMIDSCIAAGQLVQVTDQSVSHGGRFYALTPNDRAETQAVRFFTQWLVHEAAQTASTA